MLRPKKAALDPAGEFGIDYVRLPDPGLPDIDLRQLLYDALANTSLSTVIYGPGHVGSCFNALLSVAGIFRCTISESGTFGMFADQPDILWYALQGPSGSAIVISFGPESDDDFRTVYIDRPLTERPLATPFTRGCVLGRGALVPVGFAEIFKEAELQKLAYLPGLEHL